MSCKTKFDRFLVYLTLTFEVKIISVFGDLQCNRHIIGNHCANYEHPWSKMKEECVMCGKTYFRIYDIYNVTMTFDSKVIWVI